MPDSKHATAHVSMGGNRNTHLPKPYARDLVLEKLAKSAIRVVTVTGPNGPVVSHLESPESNHIGLRLWAYIDSLDSRLVRI